MEEWQISNRPEILGTQSPQNVLFGAFPVDPKVKTSLSNAGGLGLIPGQRAKIPQVLGPKKQNIKQRQYCNKFFKDFKNGPHQKNHLEMSCTYMYKLNMLTVYLNVFKC